jgi:hypothetical protein
MELCISSLHPGAYGLPVITNTDVLAERTTLAPLNV